MDSCSKTLSLSQFPKQMERYRTVGYVQPVTVYVLMFSVPSPALAGSAINLPTGSGTGSVLVQFRQSREAHLVKSSVLHNKIVTVLKRR